MIEWLVKKKKKKSEQNKFLTQTDLKTIKHITISCSDYPQQKFNNRCSHHHEQHPDRSGHQRLGWMTGHLFIAGQSHSHTIIKDEFLTSRSQLSYNLEKKWIDALKILCLFLSCLLIRRGLVLYTFFYYDISNWIWSWLQRMFYPWRTTFLRKYKDIFKESACLLACLRGRERCTPPLFTCLADDVELLFVPGSQSQLI